MHRPGLVLLSPNSGKRFRRIIRHTAAHRPRISPRRILAEQPGKKNWFGIQVGAQTIIGAGSNKVYHCIETHGRGANPSFRTCVSGSNLFPARTGADAIAAVVTTTS